MSHTIICPVLTSSGNYISNVYVVNMPVYATNYYLTGITPINIEMYSSYETFVDIAHSLASNKRPYDKLIVLKSETDRTQIIKTEFVATAEDEKSDIIKKIHDSVSEYLYEIYGFYNVIDHSYGAYVKESVSSNKKLMTLEDGHKFTKAHFLFNTSNLVNVSIGSSSLGTDILNNVSVSSTSNLTVDLDPSVKDIYITRTTGKSVDVIMKLTKE